MKERIKNINKTKIITFAIMFILVNIIVGSVVIAVDELTDDSARISSAEIIQMKTGTGPFDSNDEPGNDSSEDNKIVRSFDQVTWTVENTMTLNNDESEGYSGGKIYFEAKLPDVFTSETAKWDLSSMKWAEGVSTSNDGLTITGYYQMSNNSITVPGKQSLVFVAKILGAANGTQFAPEITVWLNGNTESEYKKVVSDTVTVSAVTKLNLNLRNNFKLSTKSTLDFNGEKVTGRVYGYGVMLELYNDSASKGLKGIEYPKGPITFEVDTNLERVSVENPDQREDITANCTPRLWDYKINNMNSKGLLGRDMYFGNVTRSYSFRQLPYGDRRTDGLDSVCNSGNITVTQEGSKLYFTVDNYKFDGIFPRYFYPFERTGIIYGENRGAFSVLYFQVVVPDNEYSLQKMSDYYLSVNVNNLNATSLTGKNITSQQRTDDDSARVQHVILREGKYNQDTRIRGNTYSGFLSEPYSAGNAFSSIGSRIIAWFSTIGGNDNDQENALYTVNKVIKFDGDAFEPISVNNTYYTTSLAENVGENLRYKMWFLTKKDGTNWTSQSEMNYAVIDDLVMYENYEDIPEGHLCIGEYYENQEGYIVTGYFIININLRVKDTASIGKTYGMTQNTIAFNEKLDRSVYTATNPNVSWPKAAYNSVGINYVKTEYDENFNIVKGTHNGGNIYGQTLLIVGADLKVEKKAMVDENSQEEKVNFDFSKNEYDVTYKVTPTLLNSATTEKNITGVNLKCVDTLPNGVTYTVGSSNYGEPDVTKNDDGTTTLVWHINNATVNEEIKPIIYKAHISEELSNGTILNSTTTIDEVPYTDENGKEVYKIGKIPTSNYGTRKSTSSINVINLASHRLYKSIDTPVIEKNGDIHFTVSYKNNTDESIPDFQLLDVLPYNGDDRGTNFSGTYTLDRLVVSQEDVSGNVISNNNLKIVYTNDSNVRENVTSKDENLGDGWTQVTNEKINKEATAFVVKGEAVPQGKVTVDIYLKTNGNKGADKYVNSSSAQVYKKTEEIVTSHVMSQVVQRNIEGIAWIDENVNGLKDDSESLLENVNMTLIDGKGNTIATTKTDNKGYYSFIDLDKGDYSVKVEIPETKYLLTQKDVGSNAEINSKFNPDTLQTDIITKLNSSDIPKIVASNQNAGFVKKETKVIVNYKEVGTDKILYDETTITGRVDSPYMTEDKIEEINLAHDGIYEFESVDGQTEGNMTEDVIYITYWYQKIPTNVIVKYVDVDTLEELIDGEEIYGRVDDEYKTKDKVEQINEVQINKYVLVKTTENTEGTMTKDTIEVIYYYKKVEAQVIVKFVDNDTDEEIADRDYLGGFVGDDYTTEPKEIPGYELVKRKIPANKDGKYTEDIIEVIYYYRKLPEPLNTGDIAVGVTIVIALASAAGILYVIKRRNSEN